MFGREEKVPPSRLTFVQYGILAIFLLLAFGLWRLQVMNSEKYDSLAQQNRIKDVPILAPRGKILDREGRIIVDNYPSFSALLLRDQTRNIEPDIAGIASGLHLDPDELRLRVKRMSSLPGYQPIFLKFDITPDELAFIESHRNEYPELDTITVHRRLYPKNGFMAHLIGYVGEVSEDMLNLERYQFNNSGDVVGQSGVESEYNDMLMGTNGKRRVMVNSKGKEVGELSDQPAVPGKQLKLTVDIDLQIASEEALGDREGAIIAMDPKNGEVLALVSRPAFDPNAFAVRISSKEWSALINDPGKPLMNKAIQAQLAPGSVFKIIMSVAGWQEGIAQTLAVHCNGGANFYGRRFACWEKGGHGGVTLEKGIAQSCDVYFYTLAERLGIQRIAKYATALGLGQKTGIDLPQEVSGIMPSEEWKIKNYKQKWYAGETISVGIGQGAVVTTPAQLMRAIGAISTGGHLVVPHVANPSELPQNYLQVRHYNDVKEVALDPGGWNMITDAMTEVLLPGGTAPSAHIPGIDIAGKTGSAQTISNAAKSRVANKADFKDNGWFVGFTPRRNPDIIVAVLFVGGEHGKLAGRIATQVIKSFVEKQRKAQVNVAGRSVPVENATPANGSVPAVKAVVPATDAQNKPAEMTGLSSGTGEHADEIQGSRTTIPVDGKFAKAPGAPGMPASKPDGTSGGPVEPVAVKAASKVPKQNSNQKAPVHTSQPAVVDERREH